MRYLENNDPPTFRRIGRQLLSAASPWSSAQDLASPIPLATAVNDLAANYDSFRESPIESDAMQRLPKQVRAAPGTSGVARALGDSGLGRTLNLSPADIDYLNQTIFGGSGRQATWTADQIGRLLGLGQAAAPNRASPDVQASRIPGVHGFWQLAPASGLGARYRAFDEEQRSIDDRVMQLLRDTTTRLGQTYQRANSVVRRAMEQDLRTQEENKAKIRLGIPLRGGAPSAVPPALPTPVRRP